MNLLQSAARLVSGVVFLVLTFKAGAYLFTATYIGVAIVQLLGAGTTLYTVRNVRRAAPVSELPQEPFWKRWWAPWKSRDFRWVWFTRFLSTLAFAMISNYFYYYLTDMFPNYLLFGYDLKDAKAAAIMVVLSMSLLGVFGALIAAPLADSWGRKPLIYLSGLSIFAVLLPFALVRDLTTVFLLTIPFGVAFGIYVSADWALATDILPNKEDAGTQMGVWSMSVTSVQIVAGAAGPFIDWGNRLHMGLGYTGLIWTSGAIFAISTVLIKQVKGSR
jgi:MFS family permease